MRPPLLSQLAGASALALASVLFAAAPAGAATAAPAAAGAYDGDEPRLVARLHVDPRGDGSWRVGVELIPDPGWHVYWRDPGDTGLPPSIEWRLPGARFGAIAWPTPSAFRDSDADLVSFGYDRPVLLASTAELPRDADTLTASVEALVCGNMCLPGRFDLAIALAPGAPDPADRARFEAAAREIPGSAHERGVQAQIAALAPGDHAAPRAELRVFACGVAAASAPCRIASAAGAGPALFPYASPDIAWRASPPRPLPDAPGAFAIDLEGTWLAAPGSLGDAVVAGVVPLRDADGRDVSVEISQSVSASAPAGRAALNETASALPWLRAVLLGWIGGLILNLMPCVLPVLAIKLASLASLAQSSRREPFRHAAAYTGGVLLSMLALALTVLALRAAGTAVGWGFQLQEPGFVAAISALLVAFALNLFGAFEIQADTGRLGGIGIRAPGAARSFFDGLLAVALATPCSAPFLGTAVGFAFASSAPVIVSIFLAIGLGLATPFALAAVSPGWTRRIPRSGAWIADLRGALGFALLLTVVWLLWILGRVASTDAIAGVLALLLAVAAACCVLGTVQRRGRPVSVVAVACALAAITGLGLNTLDLAPQPAAGGEAPAIRSARTFEDRLVGESLAAGRPVFVYFTADWCVTCKVNEKSVLSDRRVEPELARLGYDVYHADWTRRDETIRSALARLGKAGVPVYALYRPDAPARPRLLPEILTVDTLVSALRETADAPRHESVTPLTESAPARFDVPIHRRNRTL